MDIDSTIEIAPGVHMPRLGLGTYKTAEGPEVEASVAAALAHGYRSIDTASLYANEVGVGRAIAASGLPRDDLFVATKVWNDEQGYEETLAALDRSCTKLGLDYVDLYLVHWPMPSRMAETWRAMEHLLDQGRTRAIGVCNHLEHHLKDLLALAAVPPAVDQVEFHPRLQQPGLQSLCRDTGIALESWAPIMRGAVLDIPEIVAIAERYERTSAQITLRWILQKGHVAIPKSIHEERIAENADVFGFELGAAEMDAIDQLDAGERIGPDPNGYAEPVRSRPGGDS